jgi:hypothetical protein
MSAISDAFAALTTAFTNKNTRDQAAYVPLDGSKRMTGSLQVLGDIQATGDVDGNYTVDGSGNFVPYTG